MIQVVIEWKMTEGEISILKWKDNRNVHLSSNFNNVPEVKTLDRVPLN